MKTATRMFTLSLDLCVYGTGTLAYESTAQVIERQSPKSISNVFYGCVEKAESDNVALAACQSAEKKRQDARLNTAYELLLDAVAAVSAQRAGLTRIDHLELGGRTAARFSLCKARWGRRIRKWSMCQGWMPCTRRLRRAAKPLRKRSSIRTRPSNHHR